MSKDYVLLSQKQSIFLLASCVQLVTKDRCFLNQVINMKYEISVRMWKHSLSSEPAEGAQQLACFSVCALRGRMWWLLLLAGESSKFSDPSKITKCSDGNWLDSTCNGDCKAHCPGAPPESQGWRVAGLWFTRNEHTISLVRVLVSLTSTILFVQSVWRLDPQRNVLAALVLLGPGVIAHFVTEALRAENS